MSTQSAPRRKVAGKIETRAPTITAAPPSRLTAPSLSILSPASSIRASPSSTRSSPGPRAPSPNNNGLPRRVKVGMDNMPKLGVHGPRPDDLPRRASASGSDESWVSSGGAGGAGGGGQPRVLYSPAAGGGSGPGVPSSAPPGRPGFPRSPSSTSTPGSVRAKVAPISLVTSNARAGTGAAGGTAKVRPVSAQSIFGTPSSPAAPPRRHHRTHSNASDGTASTASLSGRSNGGIAPPHPPLFSSASAPPVPPLPHQHAHSGPPPSPAPASFSTTASTPVLPTRRLSDAHAPASAAQPYHTPQPATTGPHAQSPGSSVSATSGTTAATSVPVMEAPELTTVDEPEALEAKENRKIMDLEIRNKSLLAINAMLEATRSKQVREIRDLKRKLRESRGGLYIPSLPGVPPTSLIGTAEAASASSPDAGTDGTGNPFSDDEFDEDAEDEAYERVKLVLDRLISRGREALESKAELPSAGGGRVLSGEEAERYRRQRWDEMADPPALADGDESMAETADESFADESFVSSVALSESEDGVGV